MGTCLFLPADVKLTACERQLAAARATAPHLQRMQLCPKHSSRRASRLGAPRANLSACLQAAHVHYHAHWRTATIEVALMLRM